MNWNDYSVAFQMRRTLYRVVPRDSSLWKVQQWRWWWPFWTDVNGYFDFFYRRSTAEHWLNQYLDGRATIWTAKDITHDFDGPNFRDRL